MFHDDTLTVELLNDNVSIAKIIYCFINWHGKINVSDRYLWPGKKLAIICFKILPLLILEGGKLWKPSTKTDFKLLGF